MTAGVGGPINDVMLPTVQRRPALLPVAGAILAAAAAVTGWAVPGVLASAAARPPAGWADPSLDVVGGPLPAGPNLLVIDVTSGLELQLSALDPLTGHVRWSTQISASFIPPVVLLQPVVIGTTALVLVPADGNASDPNVDIEGVNIVNGRVKWREKQTPIVTDAPVTCNNGNDFCVAAFGTNQSSTSLALINPSSGHIDTSVTGPARNLGMAPPGSAAKGDLWSTFSAVPTLMQLSPAGKVQWQQTVAKIFGGKQYNPNFGWEFAARGSIEVGSVGYPASGEKLALDEFKTEGISMANGTVRWSLPGFYMCGGDLGFISTDLLCDFSGTVTEKKSLQFSGLGLSVDGFNPASGKVTWSERATDAQSLVEDAPQPFLDGQHLVVETGNGKWSVVDTEDGRAQPVGANEVFWCEGEPGYKVTAPEGASDNGERTSEPVFAGCTAAGTQAKGLPTTQPPAVGTVADGLFVWLSPSGLRATPLR